MDEKTKLVCKPSGYAPPLSQKEANVRVPPARLVRAVAGRHQWWRLLACEPCLRVWVLGGGMGVGGDTAGVCRLRSTAPQRLPPRTCAWPRYLLTACCRRLPRRRGGWR